MLATPSSERGYPTDNLMTWNDRQYRRRSAAFDLIKFGMADPAGAYSEQQFTRPRYRDRQFGHREWLRNLIERNDRVEYHRLHDFMIAALGLRVTCS